VKESAQPVRTPDQSSAIIVGVLLAGEEDTTNEDLDELTQLLATLRIQVGGRVVQKRQKITPKCFVGEGKVEEIKKLAIDTAAGMIIFDRQLSGPQVRNLEEMTGCAISDRTGIILEIFARHARTTQAKTQVEIARIEYMMPRLAGAWSHLERQRGGGAARHGRKADRSRSAHGARPHESLKTPVAKHRQGPPEPAQSPDQ
jgi:GTP-binding protein HflX